MFEFRFIFCKVDLLAGLVLHTVAVHVDTLVFLLQKLLRPILSRNILDVSIPAP